MISVTPDKLVHVQALLDRLANPRPLLESVGKILQKSAVARITTTKTAPDGTPWKPWAPATLAARAKNGTSSRGLLYESGLLSRSIVYEVNGTKVTVGATSAAPYAPYLQDGTSRMPARPFIGISSSDTDAIRTAVQSYLAKA